MRWVLSLVLFLPLAAGLASSQSGRLEAGDTLTVECATGYIEVRERTRKLMEIECFSEEPTIPPPTE